MLRLSFVFAIILAPLMAEDISGRWSGSIEGSAAPPLFFEFCRAGDGLAGAVGWRGDFLSPVENLRLAGSALTFEMHLPMGPAARFSGTVEGSRISGGLTSEAAGLRGTLELKRAGDASRLPSAPAPPQNRDDLTPLSDDFDKPAALKNWKNLAAAESLPNRIETIDVNRTSPGQLYIVPKSGAWWAGYHGIYLFKEVKGDFVLTTRLKITGRTGGEPEKIWTISGLLVRAPAALKLPLDQRKENWIYVMTGRGPNKDRVIDAKSTRDSQNVWDITPAQAGWYELRIARVGPLFVLMCRAGGSEWTVRKRIYREDLPETVQAGINVTSDFNVSASMPAAKYNSELFPESRPDSATVFDYVRFSRLGESVLRELAGREVAGIADSDLLAILK